MINLVSCIPIAKALGQGTYPKCGAGLGYHLIVGPLFWESHHPTALPYTKYMEQSKALGYHGEVQIIKDT
jgi:hypothetical protein